MAELIRTLVRTNLLETYDVIVLKGEADGEDRPDVVGLKIVEAMDELFPTDDQPAGYVAPTQEQLTPFQAGYVADHVTRLLLPAAIDYYQKRTGRRDAASRPSGVTPLGGESRENYDRVQAMFDLDALLEKRLAARSSRFKRIRFASFSPTGIAIDSKPSDLVTEDPRLMPSPSGLTGVGLRKPPKSWFDS